MKPYGGGVTAGAGAGAFTPHTTRDHARSCR